MVGCKAMMRDGSWYAYHGKGAKYHLAAAAGDVALCNKKVLLVAETSIVVSKENSRLVCKRCAKIKQKSNGAKP
jgi:hypothetical protein